MRWLWHIGNADDAQLASTAQQLGVDVDQLVAVREIAQQLERFAERPTAEAWHGIFYAREAIRRATAPTSGPSSSSPVSTSPVSTSPVSTGPISTSPASTSPASVAPVSAASAPHHGAPAASAPPSSPKPAVPPVLPAVASMNPLIAVDDPLGVTAAASHVASRANPLPFASGAGAAPPPARSSLEPVASLGGTAGVSSHRRAEPALPFRGEPASAAADENDFAARFKKAVRDRRDG